MQTVNNAFQKYQSAGQNRKKRKNSNPLNFAQNESRNRLDSHDGYGIQKDVNLEYIWTTSENLRAHRNFKSSGLVTIKVGEAINSTQQILPLNAIKYKLNIIMDS